MSCTIFAGHRIASRMCNVSAVGKRGVAELTLSSRLSWRKKSTLAYRVFEETNSGITPTKTALVLHGILGSNEVEVNIEEINGSLIDAGSKLNWRTFSQKMTKANPDWRFVCLDLRGHGDSPSFAQPHTLEACASDVAELAAHLDVQPTAVLGHSFGGKVALMYLKQCTQQQQPCPRQIWVLDALPGTDVTDYASRDLTNSIETILPIVKKIPLPVRSKTQLVNELQQSGVPLGEAQWLTTNLRLISSSPELYEWKMDVDVIEQLFHSFFNYGSVAYD